MLFGTNIFMILCVCTTHYSLLYGVVLYM